MRIFMASGGSPIFCIWASAGAAHAGIKAMTAQTVKFGFMAFVSLPALIMSFSPLRSAANISRRGKAVKARRIVDQELGLRGRGHRKARDEVDQIGFVDVV